MTYQEAQVIKEIIGRTKTDQVRLKLILNANEDRLEKAQGRAFLKLQDQVAQLQFAFNAISDALDELYKI